MDVMTAKFLIHLLLLLLVNQTGQYNLVRWGFFWSCCSYLDFRGDFPNHLKLYKFSIARETLLKLLQRVFQY